MHVLLNFINMKKTILIALAGMMLFAFTQCGNSNTTKTEGENQENTVKVDEPAATELQKLDVTGSDEFVDTYNMLYDLTKAVCEAKNCDDIEGAYMTAFFSALANAKEYAEDQKMTEEEQTKLNEISEEYEKLISQKTEEFGCEEEETEEAE